jgi:hypothetical protein
VYCKINKQIIKKISDIEVEITQMKKKVGIITLHGYENYGNKLQNYALQEIVKGLGFEVHTLVINTAQAPMCRNKYLRKIKSIIQKPINVIYKELIKLINRKLYYHKNKESIEGKIRIFKEFSNIFLNEKYYSNQHLDLEKINKDYDYFITGSDQVWNPLYINKSPLYFLTFTDKEKRIAYAPSFGRDDIPKEYQEIFRKWILEMAYLSVREESGKEIIKNITGKDATVLVDPTLLISKEKWLDIARISKCKTNDNYILTYFLGGKDKETEKNILDISRKNNLKIISMANINNKKTYKTGPSEFIDYINSASLFLTDSFHGVVFSILMEVPFVVYKRITKSFSMYSRIETLLDMFNLRSREINNIKKMENIFNIDFSYIPNILEAERKKALDYLKTALDVKE